MKLQLLYNIYPEYLKIVFISDSVIQNDMSRLKPGDMPAIRSGFFEFQAAGFAYSIIL